MRLATAWETRLPDRPTARLVRSLSAHALPAAADTSVAPASSVSFMMAEENQETKDEAPLEQVTFEMNEASSPEAMSAIREAVRGLNGVRDIEFIGGGALVTFNPLGITKEEICTAIRRSGYRATQINSAGAS
jgi:hypothetical protein